MMSTCSDKVSFPIFRYNGKWVFGDKTEIPAKFFEKFEMISMEYPRGKCMRWFEVSGQESIEELSAEYEKHESECLDAFEWNDRRITKEGL